MQTTPSVQMLLIDGSEQREIIISHSPFTLGRSPGKDVVLPYLYISRNHAEIVYEPAREPAREPGTEMGREQGRFHLVDTGSRSGCYINGNRVERHPLAPGDVIQLGSTEGPQLQFGKIDDSTMKLRGLLQQIQYPSRPESELEKLSWFLEAARKMNDVGAVEEILAALVETTLQLTQVERGYVFLKDASGDLRLAASRNLHRQPLKDDATISRSAIHQSLRSASEFIVTDTLSAEAGSPSQSVVAQNIRTVICIPLRKRNAEQAAPAPSSWQNGQNGQDGLATKVIQDREVLGVLYLDSRQQRGTLTRIDSDLLKTIATEAAVLVENASLAQAEESARRYREELKIAAEIQRELMAVRLPQLAYARVQASSVPCKEIGGDFYDVLAMESGLYIVVADISGKGISAALLGSTLQGLVHSQILAGQSLANIAMFANRYICNKEIQKYATLVLLKLTPDGYVEYLNCGHVQPLHQRTDGTLTQLGNGNLPVGLLGEAEYVSEMICMDQGERIIIVTDGVTEAEDPDGEFYGDARLESSILSGNSVEQLFGQVLSFTRGAPANDDCTMLEVCYGRCAN